MVWNYIYFKESDSLIIVKKLEKESTESDEQKSSSSAEPKSTSSEPRLGVRQLQLSRTEMEMIVLAINVYQNIAETFSALSSLVSTNNHFKVFSALLELQPEWGKWPRDVTATVTRTTVTSSKDRNWAGGSSRPRDFAVSSLSPLNLGSGMDCMIRPGRLR